MIDRYARPAMKAIWEAETRFQKWLEVEIAACEAHVELGNIPAEAVEEIKAKAQFNVDRILEIEAEVQHDVIAFLTCVAEYVGPSSRFVHLGLTSSDVVDTAFSMLIQDAGAILLNDIDELMASIKKQADTYKYTLCMGRTHGVHAEPTTFGLKLTIWYDELRRQRRRLENALDEANVGKISGAVGNFAHMPPTLEAKVCAKVGLRVAPISTQILQRDLHAAVISVCALIAGTLEKMAVEIRGLQKTEFNEVLEPFSSKQKGSSAMPHKKNPIMCERVTGLSRTIRGYALTAFENQALWHERDISHSSAERIIFPDTTVTLDYMFSVMKKIIDGLVVNEAQMKENIGRSYNVFFSQQLLLKLVEKGMLREDAYRVVQQNALSAFQERVLFDDKIRKDATITSHVSEEELNELFSFEKYTAHVDEIFSRVY